MNTLGIALVWAAVQVTLQATVATFLCLVVGRRRPEAGATIAALGLAACIGLTILALRPLPA